MTGTESSLFINVRLHNEHEHYFLKCDISLFDKNVQEERETVASIFSAKFRLKCLVRLE